jgi:Uncharacterized conserved protein
MPTKTTISRRTFNKPDQTADDLCQGLLNQDLPNAVGFLSCSADAAYRDLISKLDRDLPFPIVGGTTWAFPAATQDEDLTATLTVFYQNDFKRAICLSPLLDENISHDQMTGLYQKCRDQLGTAPKLLLVFMPLLENSGADLYLGPLFEAAGETPVFGGMVSDDLGSDRAAVLAEGQAWPDRLVLVALGGDIDPIISINCQLTIFSDHRPTVTEARGPVVRRVDGRPFADYARRLNINPDSWDLMSDWPLSVQIWGGLSEVDGHPEVADLIRIDPAEGGFFARDIPEGSRICLSGLTKNNVIDSALTCLEDITDKIRQKKAEGREISLLLVIPCLSRYYAMVGDDRWVDGLIKSKLPEHLNVFSFYSYNEIGPSIDRQGRLFNRTHSGSVIVCGI